MPAGPRRVPPVEEVKQHPLETTPCRLAQLLPEARQPASLGKVRPSNLAHSDTLPSVTNHSERAQQARSPVAQASACPERSPRASCRPYPTKELHCLINTLHRRATDVGL